MAGWVKDHEQGSTPGLHLEENMHMSEELLSPRTKTETALLTLQVSIEYDTFSACQRLIRQILVYLKRCVISVDQHQPNIQSHTDSNGVFGPLQIPASDRKSLDCRLKDALDRLPSGRRNAFTSFLFDPELHHREIEICDVLFEEYEVDYKAYLAMSQIRKGKPTYL